MPKNTIDDQILKGMGLVHIKDSLPSTVRIEWQSSVKYIKQALYQDLLELVGDNEIIEQKASYHEKDIAIMLTHRDMLRAELRAKLKQYFGKDE